MGTWYRKNSLKSKNYICGFCSSDITSKDGYYISISENSSTPTGEGYIYICHKCNKPTFFDYYVQTPGSIYGKSFDEKIFPDNSTFLLYNEIRNCIGCRAYTSAVLAARKLLMHISVNCGANEGENFVYYVNYLDENGYISKNCKKWVDIIRKKGNEANHEIQIFSESEAKQIIKFIEIMISVIYEMPSEADLFESE